MAQDIKRCGGARCGELDLTDLETSPSDILCGHVFRFPLRWELKHSQSINEIA